MKRDATTIGTVIGILLLLAAAITIGRDPSPERSSAPSTLVASPRGLKALYLALEDSGLEVERLAEGWELLGSREGLLVVTSPSRTAIAAAEVTALRQWIGRGNGALFLLREGEEHPPDRSLARALLGELGLRRAESSGARAIVPFPYHAGDVLASAELGRPPGFRRGGDAIAMTSLLESGKGSIVLRGEIGAGAFVVIATTAPFENGRLLQGENLRLASALIESLRYEGSVIFDEYHHGLSIPAWSSLAMHPATWTFAGQLLLAAMLFVLATARRTEPIRTPPRGAVRSRAEHVRAMAGLYAAGRHTGHVARVVLAAHDAAVRARRSTAAPVEREALAKAAARTPRERELVSLVRALANAAAPERVRPKNR